MSCVALSTEWVAYRVVWGRNAKLRSGIRHKAEITMKAGRIQLPPGRQGLVIILFPPLSLALPLGERAAERQAQWGGSSTVGGVLLTSPSSVVKPLGISLTFLTPKSRRYYLELRVTRIVADLASVGLAREAVDLLEPSY